MGLGFSCLGAGAASWVVSAVVSCFSAAACNLACKSCNCNNSIATRIGFAIILLLNSMLAWIMLSDWAIKQLEKITYDYLHLNCQDGTCYGVFAVHRICFALSFLHLLLGLLVIGVKDTRDSRAAIQNGWWGPKILMWIILIIASFFIPNQFFMFWGNYIALIGATLFILVGLVLLVDFAHTWSESCIMKWEESDSDKWKYILICSTMTMFLASIVLTGIMYGFFGGSGCGLNQFFITFNLILCIIVTFLSIAPSVQEVNSHSGLSQASMVVIYCTYIILSAVANEPDDNMCNPWIRSRNTRTATIVIGALFTFLAIAYSTSRAATQSFQSQTNYDAVESGIMPASAVDDDDEHGLDDEKNGVAYNYGFFHLIFAIASMYVAMLLTNWNHVTTTGSDELVIIGQTYVAVWVKVVSGWICLLLYAWTLIGPVLMPERFEMGMEKQPNLSNYTKKQMRKLRFFPLLVVVFVISFFTISHYNHSSDNEEFPFNDKFGGNVQDMKCPQYKIMLLIYSEAEDIDKRALMREGLFEQMEYDDIGEIEVLKGDWQLSALKYSQLLKQTCMSFDHLVLTEVYTMINLEKLQKKISSSKIADQRISSTQKLVWGSFNSNITDRMAVIMGSSAVQTILDNSEYESTNDTSVITRFYHYHYNHKTKKIPNDLILANDQMGIIEWPNSINSIPCIDCAIAIGHIYQEWEFRKIKNELNISTINPCNVRSDLKRYSKGTMSKLRSKIVVATSSFLYHDNCMLEAASLSAQNKREYAEKHGYAFVPRSSEYAQQNYRRRREVWGKIDAVEKILPYYEWLIWLDMDAIFTNRNLSVEHLLEMCEERVGGKEAFDKINFIVARPVGDDMINAGVFLIRNTEWAVDFIREGIQARRDRAYRGMKEQQAMRDAIKQPKWQPNVLYLDGDDHTINTFPDRYIMGDYIVHYAPEEGCPANPVINGITKVRMMEQNPDIEISIPF
ncbi:14469_t:CDS:10 [Funneliformis geosporum]|uniref:29_t:CDS:1 n=1 Tax=Funneliformis geosporum TaxID=1117311 RepID=A0A9W4SFK0_9GLOM|nr:29_t:CDS:10 [Funneliformis geosporum]CAI2167301.1 14469_t:CDS:10 [Funneliformis geosporum]